MTLRDGSRVYTDDDLYGDDEPLPEGIPLYIREPVLRQCKADLEARLKAVNSLLRKITALSTVSDGKKAHKTKQGCEWCGNMLVRLKDRSLVCPECLAKEVITQFTGPAGDTARKAKQPVRPAVPRRGRVKA